MDSKGIDLPGLNPAIATLIKHDKKEAPVITPVDESGKGMFRNIFQGGDQTPKLEKLPGTANMSQEEQAQLAADLLAEEFSGSQDLEVKWVYQQNSENLVVEIRNKTTGEVLRQLPPAQILGTALAQEDLSGLLLNKRV